MLKFSNGVKSIVALHRLQDTEWSAFKRGPADIDNAKRNEGPKQATISKIVDTKNVKAVLGNQKVRLQSIVIQRRLTYYFEKDVSQTHSLTAGQTYCL